MSSRQVSCEAGPSGLAANPTDLSREGKGFPGKSVHIDVIIDAENDIAMNEQRDKMVVGVPGRQRLQTFFVRKSPSGGKTTTPYKPEVDSPADDKTISIIPTVPEIEGRPETMEFLSVGIVIAKEPGRFSTKLTGATGSRNKKRDEERAKRGALPMETNVLRAMVPTSEYISTGHIKYYVACHQVHAVCNMRLVTGDTIFFFQEIWDGIPDDITTKERRRQLGSACKRLAARDKRPPQRAVIPVSTGLDPAASSIIAIAPITNAANILLMNYSMYAMTKDPSAIVSLKKSLEDILPDLLQKPTDEGVVAFYDFDSILELEDAENLVTALEATYPSIMKFSPPLIVELHAALRRKDIGGKLPYGSLLAFLRWGHDRAVVGWSAERVESVVELIIHDIDISDYVQKIASTKTISEMTDGPADLRPFVSGIRVALIELRNYLTWQAKAIRDQHGGVIKHDSIEEIMVRVGNCIDKTSLKLYEEQIFAIHAEQLATRNGGAADYTERLIKLTDDALAVSG